MAAEKPIDIWRRYDAVESRLSAGLSERMLDLARIVPGMRVLDLAAGRGEPAILVAQRVGAGGFVLGVDLDDTLLEMAREKAKAAALTNIEFRAQNAETLDGIAPASFDAVTARWGLMYMSDPIAALSNAHRALKANGVLIAALWAEPERVPYYTMPRALLPSAPPIDRRAPGVFRYADVEVIERDFASAGFLLEHVEELDVPVIETRTLEEIKEWVLTFGLARLLDPLPDDERRTWDARFTHEAAKLETNGVFQLGGVTRIVVAHPASPTRRRSEP